MEKERFFKYIKTINNQQLIELLDSAFNVMTVKQRYNVFSKIMKEVPEYSVNGADLLDKINQFHNDSLNGIYYAPFDINSKNFMYIPEETEQWFDTLGNYLESSRILSNQGEHEHAVECFHKLYDLIDIMNKGDEIVFADEYGDWMIPIDEKPCIKSFFKSLAAIATPTKFMKYALPIIKRDSYDSFALKAYPAAMEVISHEQKISLLHEMKRKKIRTNVEDKINEN